MVSYIVSKSSMMGDSCSFAYSNQASKPGGGSMPYRRRYSSCAAVYVRDCVSRSCSKSARALWARISTGWDWKLPKRVGASACEVRMAMMLAR